MWKNKWKIYFYTSALLSFASFFCILLFLAWKGVPQMRASLFALEYNSDNVSLFPSLISTLYLVLLVLGIALPLGIGTAIYMVEYSRGKKALFLIRLAIESLAGIPSIVYGLFGMLFFVTKLHLSFSILAGAATLAIMVLPLIIRCTEESLRAVPDSYREASYGLGAGQLRTIFRVVLPSAKRGIFTGIMLSVGRIVGETAALIYTAGTVARIPLHLTDSARTLSVHVYQLASEGLHVEEAYASAFILILFILVWNLVMKRIGRSKDENI